MSRGSRGGDFPLWASIGLLICSFVCPFLVILLLFISYKPSQSTAERISSIQAVLLIGGAILVAILCPIIVIVGCAIEGFSYMFGEYGFAFAVVIMDLHLALHLWYKRIASRNALVLGEDETTPIDNPLYEQPNQPVAREKREQGCAFSLLVFAYLGVVCFCFFNESINDFFTALIFGYGMAYLIKHYF